MLLFVDWYLPLFDDDVTRFVVHLILFVEAVDGLFHLMVMLEADGMPIIW
jgi:hypothetical protein